MALDPLEIIDVADFIAIGSNDRQAYIRSAVSRYYYAAFSDARTLEHRVSAGREYSDIGMHMRVINKFLDYDGPEKKLIHRIGKELQRFKTVRTQADYILERDFPRVGVRESKARAERIMEWCQTARTKI